MSTESHRLALYIENDGEIYRQHTLPTIRLHDAKRRAGAYDADKAMISWRRIADIGAKKYAHEFGAPDQPWNRMFSVADRKDCAAELMEYYRDHLA